MYKKIGYLGPQGSYSMLAAKSFCPNAEHLEYASFYLVAQALKSGEVDAIVLPIENSLNGGVMQNIDLLQQNKNLIAVKECKIKIDHRLIYLKGADLSKIKTIYSHNQALAQCAKFLQKNYPNAKLVATPSTAGSIEMIKSPDQMGIVGAHLSVSGFELSNYGIADEPNNFTQFLLVVRGREEQICKHDKIYFSFTCPHEPGALLKMLALLSELNMTKIESRPIKEKVGEFRFFIEVAASLDDQKVKSALFALKQKATSFKILGCY